MASVEQGSGFGQIDNISETGKSPEFQLNLPPKIADDLNKYVDDKLKYLAEESQKQGSDQKYYQQMTQAAENPKLAEYFIQHLHKPETDIKQAQIRLNDTIKNTERTNRTKTRWQMIQRIVNDEPMGAGEQSEFQRQISEIATIDQTIVSKPPREQRAAILMDFLDRRMERKRGQIAEAQNPEKRYQDQLDREKTAVAQETGHSNPRRIEQLAKQRLQQKGIKPPLSGARKALEWRIGLPPRAKRSASELKQLSNWQNVLQKTGFKKIGTTKTDYGN